MHRFVISCAILFWSCGAFAQNTVSPSFGALLVNPRVTLSAPTYTTGNTAEVRVGDSNVSLPNLWALLYGSAGHATHDGTASVTSSIVGTTALQVNGLAGYCDNYNSNNVSSGVGVCVGVAPLVINRVDGAESWWLAAIAADAGSSGGTGRLIQGEVDFKPLFSNTAVNGLIFTMDSPVSLTTADALIVGSTSTTHRWNNAFRTYPGATANAFYAGQTQPPGAISANSTPIVMEASDGLGTSHLGRLIIEGSASSLVVDRDDGAVMNITLPNGSVNLTAGKTYNVNGAQVVTQRQVITAPTYSTITPNSGAFNYDTATLDQLKSRVLALEIALRTHGLIGN